MLVKDLPDGVSLKGYKLRVPGIGEGFWNKQLAQEVWLTNKPREGSVIRVPMTDTSKIMDWEILEEPTSRRKRKT